VTRRILVTGSRDWAARTVVRKALDDIGFQHGFDGLIVVHGACRDRDGNLLGADRWADEWADHNWDLGVRKERYPADWDRHGRHAGPVRNHHMVSLGADECLAFLGPCTRRRCREPKPHDSHGAAGCADLAEKAGIPVRRYRSDDPAREPPGGGTRPQTTP
jgi:hypothetical protein